MDRKLLAILNFIILAIVIFILSVHTAPSQAIDVMNYGDYLGQTPPGMVPELFPPTELQADSTWFWHGSPMFSPDLTEMYFTKYIKTPTRHHTEIQYVKYQNGQWTAPQKAPFANSNYSENNPFFSQSKDTLYFQSQRPGGFIFRVTRTGDNWSQPVPLTIPIPAGKNPGLQFSMTKNRTIYGEIWENNDLNIYRWRFVNGNYTAAEKLTGGINTAQYDFMPFIDPDERFLLFCSQRSGGYGMTDIYVSFHKDDGTWSSPKNLGALFNTAEEDGWPTISPDGKYIFFCRSYENGFNPFWVAAKILETYGARPYLDQNPPGIMPVTFPLSIMINAYGLAFSPDGKELFYTKYDGQKNIIWHTNIENYQWNTHTVAFFSGEYMDMEPHISPDGQRLFFASQRPILGETPADFLHGWYCEKTVTGWSEPKLIPSPLDTCKMMFITEAKNRNLYFTNPDEAVLYVAKWENGTYHVPERLSTQTINKFPHQAHPFITPDESYLIFDASVTDGADTDLYVSFRNPDNSWGNARKIDAVNTSAYEGIAFISRNDKYFFFQRNGDLYWVDAKILENYSPGSVIAYSITPPNDNNEIFLINADGSGKTQLTNRPGRDCGPAYSPDLTKIAFYVHFDDRNWSEYIMDADGGNIVRLTNQQNVCDGAPCWTPDGRIVFGREYPLENYRSEIWTINPDGTGLRRIGDVDGGEPDCSPDGTTIAYCSFADGDGEIWVMQIDGTNPVRLTDNQFQDGWPSWSPDGSKLAFQSNRDGNHEIYVMNADGSNPTRITNNTAAEWNPDWSPDGTKFVFVSDRDGHYEIYTMNSDGSNQTRVTTTNVHAIQPRWKPIPTSTSVKESEIARNVVPENFRLFQNYPNPFNAKTTISFELKTPSIISLKIFDVLGREKQTLVQHEFYKEGQHSLTFNASLLSSSIYFYKLSSHHGYTLVKKMCVLK